MLITTCPDCSTTFKISVGILEKAGGQVRCGRCATIFDANVNLREFEHPEELADSDLKFQLQDEENAPAAAGEQPLDAPAGQALDEPDETGETGETSTAIEAVLSAATGSTPDQQPETDDDSGAADDAGAEDDADRDTGDDTSQHSEISADSPAPDWLPPEPGPRRRWPWAVGTLVMALAIVAQLTHQHRRELIEWPLLGPPLGDVYVGLGHQVTPTVDLNQFELADLTAAVEPSGGDRDLLLIETRLRNRGPKTQAYPHIFVRLLDRWQETIAGRYFTPEEYAVDEIGPGERMSPGATTTVQFAIMDPGPSATGFELELCEEVAGKYICESDLAAR